MYCNQCGKEICETAKFCSNCGHQIPIKRKTKLTSEQLEVNDAANNLRKELKQIDKRKKTVIKTGKKQKATRYAVKETSSWDLIFGDNFESEKFEEKKQLIYNYPIPDSLNELVSFAEYINLEIEANKDKNDVLAIIWLKKLKQVYLFVKAKFGTTDEFLQIKKYYKINKHKVIRKHSRELVVLLAFFIIPIFIFSILLNWPLMIFAAILAAGWETFLILYVFEVLDKMISSIKQHSAKQKKVPKSLRSIAWHLLVPLLAALITSIIYQSVGLIILFAILFVVDAYFLALFLCEVYES